MLFFVFQSFTPAYAVFRLCNHRLLRSFVTLRHNGGFVVFRTSKALHTCNAFQAFTLACAVFRLCNHRLLRSFAYATSQRRFRSVSDFQGIAHLQHLSVLHTGLRCLLTVTTKRNCYVFFRINS